MPYKDKETQRLRNQKYYLAHKEEIQTRSKEWATNNHERRKEINRNFAKRNYKPGDEAAKQTATARTIAWQKANPEKINTKNRNWYAANPEKSKESRKKWRLLNSDKTHELKQIRRARELGAYVEHVNRTVVYKNAHGICGICNLPVKRRIFHVDHIVPLSRGGLHCYTNTQPAHPTCNRKKSNKLNYSGASEKST